MHKKIAITRLKCLTNEYKNKLKKKPPNVALKVLVYTILVEMYVRWHPRVVVVKGYCSEESLSKYFELYHSHLKIKPYKYKCV